jgi:ribonuclease HI
MKLRVNCDGGSRGNPGPAAIGLVIRKDDDTILYEFRERIGEATNNEAEYQSVLKALELATGYDPESITVEMDSELIVKQLNGAYDVNADNLQPLHDEVKTIIDDYMVRFEHVPRDTDFQQLADDLVNEALDQD